uniref:Signal peptidase complex subunit 1 n=1 Tax=Lates calcarifer TaxID=8187 RepID=A0A4W6DIS0_LATCA
MGLSQNDVSFLRPEVKLLRFVTVRTKVCQIDLTSSGKMLDIFKSIPTHMDYKGQKLAEQIFQGIILISAVIGFVYGLIIEQFGWTVYIVLAGFAISCVVSFCLLCFVLLFSLFETTDNIKYIHFSASLSLVDPAPVAYVQKESPVLAASSTRDQWRVQPKTSGKPQEEEAQITQSYQCPAVNTSFYIKRNMFFSWFIFEAFMKKTLLQCLLVITN